MIDALVELGVEAERLTGRLGGQPITHPGDSTNRELAGLVHAGTDGDELAALRQEITPHVMNAPLGQVRTARCALASLGRNRRAPGRRRDSGRSRLPGSRGRPGRTRRDTMDTAAAGLNVKLACVAASVVTCQLLYAASWSRFQRNKVLLEAGEVGGAANRVVACIHAAVVVVAALIAVLTIEPTDPVYLGRFKSSFVGELGISVSIG